MSAIIQLRNVSKKFGGAAVVDDVSLDIFDGEFLAILGPSGCGKTTLLRMIGGFDYPDGGRVLMGDDDITLAPPNRRQINMVFQTYAVFPHMSVWDNVAYGLKLQKLRGDEVARRVEEALALAQMSDFARRAPDKLSGGQRQRVALARAMIMRPKVLLLDEPLSALDAKLRESMQSELVNLQRTVGITFVIVTHDQSEALSMASRIAVMQRGVFRQIDPPPVLYEQPNCRFVADFIGRMNIFRCRAARVTDGGCVAVTLMNGATYVVAPPPSLSLSADVLSRLCLGARPEKLAFSAAAADGGGGDDGSGGGDRIAFEVTVVQSSYYGSDVILHCRSDWHDGDIICQSSRAVAAGQRGWLSAALTHCPIFPDD